ncbi:MAG TPA: LysM peptidoglycan-binding domain-containing protein [Desulfosalsimonadaceae bacterium]|nr:LysM peptidoglycan-binding domain-containing protein [Desulfosalsimonadaceae bacterium]
MDWKSEVDAENEELNDKPYSTFSNEDPQRFLNRPKYPYLLLGAGVLLLIVLVLVFFPNNPESANEAGNEATNQTRPVANDDSMARLDRIESKIDALEGVQDRLAQLENRIAGLEENFRLINEGDISATSENPEQLQANAQLIQNTANRLDAIEKRLNQMEKQVAANKSQFDNLQPSSQTTQTTEVHMVKKGDTLYSLSRKYDVNLDKLLRANGLSKKAVIYPGQKLKIP